MAGKCPMHGNPMPFDEQYFVDPYSTYAELHKTGHAHQVCDENQNPHWLVTRYDDVRDGLRDHRLARNPEYAGADFPGDPFPEELLTGNLLIEDPPVHTRLRRFVNFAFIPRRVNALRPRIQEIVDELLDEIARDGKADLMESLASPLPITVICDLLGVPAEFRADFRTASDKMLAGSEEEAEQAVGPLIGMLTELIAMRRAEPTDDLISHWIRTPDGDGNQLSEAELLSLSFFMLIAGFETTAATLGQILLTLLRFPDVAAKLRANPDLYPAAIEEMIRWDGAVQGGVRRFATEDLTIGDNTIKAGDVVILSFGAAGRDPRRYAEPEVLDFDRQEKPHLSFGLGPHVCPGMELGRAEMQTAIKALFERFPDLRLAIPYEQLRWRKSTFIRVLRELPVIV